MMGSIQHGRAMMDPTCYGLSILGDSRTSIRTFLVSVLLGPWQDELVHWHYIFGPWDLYDGHRVKLVYRLFHLF